MFWKILLFTGGGGALAGTAAYLAKHSKKGGSAPPSNPIAPAGAAQPPGVVAIPIGIAAGAPGADAVQAAARALLTALAQSPPVKGSLPAVKAFRIAYNATKPPVLLKADGEYGPKAQAALQSVIAPAIAPANFFGTAGHVTVAKPAIPAASPLPNVDVTGAANVLAAMVSIPKTSDRRVSTFQAAFNATPGVLHLATDGKYGGETEGALQSVLDWLGTGLTAPKNPFGPAAAQASYPPNWVEV